MILLPSEVSCRSLFYWIKKYKYVLAASGIRPKESLELMILILFNLWIMGTRALHSAMYADWCPISQLISIHTVQQHSISYRFINAHCAHCDAVSIPAVVTPSRRRQEGRTSPSPKTQLLATRIELDARQSEAKQNMKKKKSDSVPSESIGWWCAFLLCNCPHADVSLCRRSLHIRSSVVQYKVFFLSFCFASSHSHPSVSGHRTALQPAIANRRKLG